MWERGSYFRREIEELMDEIQGKDGEWVPATSLMGCCDCGLVHQVEYMLVDRNGKLVTGLNEFKLMIRSVRDKQLTKKAREEKKFICSIKKEEV